MRKMSALQESRVWSNISKDALDSKYEKCRHITEEIYKRINITFQIKQLETVSHSDVSDHSDQIDSNELSNETDLFACDKSDSIPSSTEAEKPACSEKYININNNEETKLKQAAALYKRPKKRFRKRVKKRQSKPHSESDGSSDEALPLSRIVELDTKCVHSEECSKSGSPDNVMGVPKIIIVTKDLKPKILSPEKKPAKKTSSKDKKDRKTKDIKDKIESKPVESATDTAVEKKAMLNSSIDNIEKSVELDSNSCSVCSLSFRGGRALRRHMTKSHTTNAEEFRRSTRRDVKPA